MKEFEREEKPIKKQKQNQRKRNGKILTRGRRQQTNKDPEKLEIEQTDKD